MLSPSAFAAAKREAATRRRRRTLILAIGAGALAIIVVFLVWLFAFSQVFAVTKVVVEGNQLLSSQDVSSAAEVPMGVPLMRVDTKAVEERLGGLSEVKEVHVRLDLPNTVRIELTERVPVYQLKQGETFEWIDAEGAVVRQNQSLTDTLPTAEVTEADQRKLRDVATVIANIPKDISDALESIKLSSVDHIELQLQQDRTIVWGSADQSELKAKVISALLKVDAKVYDVSAPEHPTTQ